MPVSRAISNVCSMSVVLLVFAQSCNEEKVLAPGHEVKSDKQRIMSPDVSDLELYHLVCGDNAFALDVYDALVE